MNNYICKLRKFFKEKCNKINNEFIKRSRNINSEHILCYLLNSVSNNCKTDSSTNKCLKIEGVLKTSRQAMDKRRNNFKCSYMEDILCGLSEHISKTKLFDSSNIYAVDGSKLSLNKKIEGFKLTKNNKYKKCLLNTLYSVNNKIPIGFDLSEGFNENKSFLDNLMKYIKKDDIIMFDRGYFSKKLIKEIDNKNANFICRMKKNSLCVQELNKRNTNECFYWLESYGILRIMKYIIDGKTFYLSTNMFDNKISYFSNLYHKRWYIEEYFKTIKHNMRVSNINYTKIIKIKQHIYACFILTILARYMESITNKYISKNNNKNSYINFKQAIELTGHHIIINLLIKQSTKKIINVLHVINDDRINNIANRSYQRIRIKPVSKWYYEGISLKNKNMG